MERKPEEQGAVAGAIRVLVVDATEVVAQALRRALPPGFVVAVASNAAAALLDLAADLFDVAVVDVRGHGARRFGSIPEIRAASPVTEVVAVGGHRRGDGQGALEGGAFALLELPFTPEAALHAVTKAGEHAQLRRQVAALRREAGAEAEAGALLGGSAAAAALRHQVELAARGSVDVLVQGERGTGKEQVARAIHEVGPRHGGPMAVVRCADTPSALLDLELFGHLRGGLGRFAEPGGAFRAARGGTLVLLDLDRLPFGMQTRLQAALQARAEGEWLPGPRLVATATCDLAEEARTGRFRRALQARLAAHTIHVPPLRERAEDLPLLAAHFLERTARVARREAPALTPEGLRVLAARAWPGNVAELEAVVRRAALSAAGPALGAEDFAAEADPAPEPAAVPEPARAAAERQAEAAAGSYRELAERALGEATRPYLVALLSEFQGNVTQAARKAQVERETLHRLLRRYGVDPASFRS